MPKPNIVEESYYDDGGGSGPNANCDNDDSNSDMVGNNSNPEIEISSLPCIESDNTGYISDTSTKNAMNTLHAPINQIQTENWNNSGADDSDG